MSEVAEMIQHAKEVRQRLLFPPNAVKDRGIDLKRKQIPPETPPTPPTENLEGVIEYPHLECIVTVTPLSPQPRTLKIKTILKAVSGYYGIPVPIIKGDSRRMIDVRPRHVVFYLASRHTGLSIAAIGRRFNRDHTTILHAVRNMTERLLVDNELASAIKILENRLLAGCYDDPSDMYRSPVASQPEPHLAQPGEGGLSGC